MNCYACKEPIPSDAPFGLVLTRGVPASAYGVATLEDFYVCPVVCSQACLRQTILTVSRLEFELPETSLLHGAVKEIEGERVAVPSDEPLPTGEAPS